MKNSQERDSMQANTNAAMPKEAVPAPVAQSVQLLRERFGGVEPVNAQDDAEKIAQHIRAINQELDALSKERAELAELCLNSIESSYKQSGEAEAVAINDYREPGGGDF